MLDYPGDPMPEKIETQPEKAPFSALAILGFIFSILFALLGFVFSIIALFDIRKTQKRGKGLAIAGIIISVINSIVGIILGIALVSNVAESLDDINTSSASATASVSASASTSAVDEYYAAHPEISPEYCQALDKPSADDPEVFAQDLEALAQVTPDQELAQSLTIMAQQTRDGNYEGLSASLDTVAPILDEHAATCAQAPTA